MWRTITLSVVMAALVFTGCEREEAKAPAPAMTVTKALPYSMI